MSGLYYVLYPIYKFQNQHKTTDPSYICFGGIYYSTTEKSRLPFSLSDQNIKLLSARPVGLANLESYCKLTWNCFTTLVTLKYYCQLRWLHDGSCSLTPTTVVTMSTWFLLLFKVLAKLINFECEILSFFLLLLKRIGRSPCVEI